MRRKKSDELPRFVSTSSPPSLRWRRRHLLFGLTGLLFLYWLLFSGRRTTEATPAVNWKKYAYSLYATDSATLCHALLIFDALARLGSKADRVLFYPNYWDTDVSDAKDRDSQLLVLARDTYKVKLQPMKLLTVRGRKTDAWTSTWDKSVTKFAAFSLAYYDRVIALDSDTTLLQSLDDLFFLPPTPIALPRAYWYPTRPWPLTSLLMVIQPSVQEFVSLKRTINGGGNDQLVQAHKFDMELINDRFEDNALVLPHRPYALLSGEFRSKNHTAYLGNPGEEWDAEKVYKEAKLVHFSDWPLPKPWIMWPQEGLAEMQPDCGGQKEGSCVERDIWKGLYNDFRIRRRDVCRLLSVPAPKWDSIKGKDKAESAGDTDGTHHEAPHADGTPEGKEQSKE